eukprot:gene5291-6588_t
MTTSSINNNNNNNIDLSNIDESLKHCGCRNAKELIQLIRSDAIEVVELSWPDDMGLWYTNSIKSHEVSLQNLVEGIKITGQLLIVDPTSARFDLSKKYKTITVRCSNINRYSSSSLSSDDDFEFEQEYADGEVVNSPRSKLSLLVDESEKVRRSLVRSSKNSPSSARGSNSVLGKRRGDGGSSAINSSTEDLEPSSWAPIEDTKKMRTSKSSELVPELSSPLFDLKRSTSPSSGSSSPLSGVPNNIDTTDSPPGPGADLANIDSAERAILEGQIHLPPLLRPRQYHACKIPKEDRPSKRRKNHTSLFCRHCGTTDTPEWRRGPDGRKSLCNACGLHYSKLVKRENMVVPQLSRSFDLSEILNPAD